MGSCAAFLIATATASAEVICVNVADTTGCGAQPAELSLAFNLANSDADADDIRVGPGTYDDGPFSDGGGFEINLIGPGVDQAELTAPDSAAIQTHLSLSAAGSSVSDLTVQIPPGANSFGDTALYLANGATAQGVSAGGVGTDNTTGLSIGGTGPTSSFIGGQVVVPLVTPSGDRAVFSGGPGEIRGSTLIGQTGVAHSGPGLELRIERSTIVAAEEGLGVDSGRVDVSNTLIDLDPAFVGGIGLDATNFNPGTGAKTITARHLTIVGGGPASIGLRAFATAPTVQQTSTVTLADSIIDGPIAPVSRQAQNNGGPLGASVANVTTTNSNYSGSILDLNGPNGGGALAQTARTTFPPGFLNPAGFNYRLAPSSPLVDLGNPAAGGPATDLDGNPRVEDGDSNGTVRRDLGAYEVQDETAPDTSITAGPDGNVADATPTFTLASTEPGSSSFTCSLDGGAFGPCSGPGESHTTAALSDGGHSLSVRATDAAGNVDPTAAARLFTVDSTAPETRIAKSPRKRLKKSKATVVFAGSAATYECKLDDAPFAPCTSPVKLTRLRKGKHTFSVRCIDEVGNVDATPATAKFRRVKKKPKK